MSARIQNSVSLLTFLAILAACGGGGAAPGGSGGLLVADPRTFHLRTNVGDPLLLSVENGNGVTYELYGARNAAGVPVDVQTIQVTAPGGEVHRIDLDAQDRPSRVTADNGVRFHFEWTGPTQATMTV